MLFFYVLFGVCAVLAEEDLAVQEIRDGNLALSAEIYKSFAANLKDNFVFSPLAAQEDGAVLQAGSFGATSEQFRDHLHLGKNQSAINEAITSLILSMRKDHSYVFDIANQLFIPENWTVKSEYYFKPRVQKVNYSISNAANIINSWVKNNTHNRVNEVITSEQLNAQTSIVVVEAFNFQANWTNQFSFKDSQRGDFYRNRTDIIKANYMFQHGFRYNYRECGFVDAYFIELPLADQNAILTIVLPKTKNGLPKVEKGIQYVFKSHDYHNFTVHLQLPKFSAETVTRGGVNIARNMGITAAFNKSEADFSGIAGNKGDLFESEIAARLNFGINEDGVNLPSAPTKAPVIGNNTNAGPIQPFIADHPFLYYVKINNVIVLAGRLVNPPN